MKVIKLMLIRREAANHICLFISFRPAFSVPSYFIYPHPLSLLSQFFFILQISFLSQVSPINVTFVLRTLQKRKILPRYVPFLENPFIIIFLIAMIGKYFQLKKYFPDGDEIPPCSSYRPALQPRFLRSALDNAHVGHGHGRAQSSWS